MENKMILISTIAEISDYVDEAVTEVLREVLNGCLERFRKAVEKDVSDALDAIDQMNDAFDFIQQYYPDYVKSIYCEFKSLIDRARKSISGGDSKKTAL